jgi:hypothetical protein
LGKVNHRGERAVQLDVCSRLIEAHRDAVDQSKDGLDAIDKGSLLIDFVRKRGKRLVYH